MNKTFRKVIAIIALVSVAIFSISFIFTLSGSKLLNGQMGFVSLFFGLLGLALFFVVRFSPIRGGEENNPEKIADKDKTNETLLNAAKNNVADLQAPKEPDNIDKPNNEK